MSTRSCEVCGRPFVRQPGQRSTIRTCSFACKTVLLTAIRQPVMDVPGRTCDRCGRSFANRQPHARFCSRSCYRAHHKGRMAERIRTNHKISPARRARIFERDGWICYLCRRPINRRLIQPHVGSPSLDHVVSIARGGQHGDDNLRAAHLGCNIDKGDRDLYWWEAS